VWSLSDRHQGLVHRVAKSLQPSPLDHCFCNSMKYGNPCQSSARMTIRHPITVLHLVFLCADHGPIAIVTGATVLARFGIYSTLRAPVDVRCRSVGRRRSCRRHTPSHTTQFLRGEPALITATPQTAHPAGKPVTPNGPQNSAPRLDHSEVAARPPRNVEHRCAPSCGRAP
jgi:hypothetical protein